MITINPNSTRLFNKHLIVYRYFAFFPFLFTITFSLVLLMKKQILYYYYSLPSNQSLYHDTKTLN